MMINSTEIIYPQSIDYDTEDVGSIYTTVSGKTVVDIVRSKRVLECEWGGLTAEQLSALLSLVDERIVNVTYYEPKTAQEETKTFVASDIQFEAYTLQETKKIFNSLEITFTEQ